MQPFRRVALCLALAGMAAALAGCGAASSIPYPRLSTVKKLKNRILSREEQEEAIRDLSAEQEQHQSEAEREIEEKK